jgi:hypothetical protein
MKKGFVFIILAVVLSSAFVIAADCELDAELINQDPYPALPGEYVKVVFELEDVGDPKCGEIVFEFIESFPFKLDPNVEKKSDIKSQTFPSNFKSSLIVPYRVRVDKDAVDGENSVRVKYSAKIVGGAPISQVEEFNITVEDVRTDFEISIKDFDDASNDLTFEILNIGEHDVEALTIEIPNQDNIKIKGSTRNIVGSLDSNEDTTFTFEAVPRDGEFDVKIIYTDEIAVRRELVKKLTYDSSYFTGRKADEVISRPTSFYIAFGLVVLMVLIWLRNRWKRKKQREKSRLASHRHRHHHKK